MHLGGELQTVLRAHELVRQRARVVHQHIQTRSVSEHAVGQRANVVESGKVGGRRGHVRAGERREDLAPRFLRASGVTADEPHLGVARRERVSRGEPDATRRTRDHHNRARHVNGRLSIPIEQDTPRRETDAAEAPDHTQLECRVGEPPEPLPRRHGETP